MLAASAAARRRRTPSWHPLRPSGRRGSAVSARRRLDGPVTASRPASWGAVPVAVPFVCPQRPVWARSPAGGPPRRSGAGDRGDAPMLRADGRGHRNVEHRNIGRKRARNRPKRPRAIERRIFAHSRPARSHALPSQRCAGQPVARRGALVIGARSMAHRQPVALGTVCSRHRELDVVAYADVRRAGARDDLGVPRWARPRAGSRPNCARPANMSPVSRLDACAVVELREAGEHVSRLDADRRPRSEADDARAAAELRDVGEHPARCPRAVAKLREASVRCSPVWARGVATRSCGHLSCRRSIEPCIDPRGLHGQPSRASA